MLRRGLSAARVRACAATAVNGVPQRRLLSAASATSPQRGAGSRALQVGDVVHNFELKRRASVPEYNIDALELEHVATKAQYLHIDAQDANNVFAVMFRTPPSSSNGVPHILEHTVLCGSRQFPVRDPFFNMIKRSLNTYMNALTAYDHTMYPFSTTNAKDWKNLLSVYLDAVFFPNLHKYDFLQEGHRLEIAAASDDGLESELVYKGVVLNEMKGVMSDSNNLFGTKLQQRLLAGTIYGHVSGGDPAHIPDLTYEELRAFHAKHYHPSNCCFYSYGDLPLTDHLAYLDTHVLKHFAYRADSAATRVDSAPFSIFRAPEDVGAPVVLETIAGPASNMTTAGAGDVDPTTKFCMTKFVDVASTDPFETFVMRIVAYLLTNGPSSPLYKALIDTNLAQDFSIGTGFDTSTYYATFGVGVEGIDTSEAGIRAIQDAVDGAYAHVLAHGFERERVDGLLHQLELSLKHIVGNFGLTLMHGASSVWSHRGDLIANLELNPILTRLRDEMARDPRFLERYVETQLMRTDTKAVHLLMVPSETYVGEQETRERQALAARLSDATNADLDRIAFQTQELEKHQQKPQPVECLPTLTLADIPVTEPRNDDSVDVASIGASASASAVPVEFVHVPTTNEISYVRLLFDITTALPLAYQTYLPLFTTVFGALGTSTLSHDVLPTVIQNCSGGISCSAMAHPSLTDARGASTQALLLGSMCLPHKLRETLDVLMAILTDTQFLAPANLAQLRILLQMSAANASHSISSSGASLASVWSRLDLTHAGVYHELYSGLTQIEQLQRWATCSDDELRDLAVILQEMAHLAFTPANLRVSVVTEAKLRADVTAALETNLVAPLDAATRGASVAPRQSVLDSFVAPTLASPTSYFGFPIAVNFNVRTLPSVSFAHADHVPLTVLAQMMSSCYLHQQVREQGGAYGSGVAQGEGYFALSSHYDPNTWATLTAYDNALRWAADGHFTDRDVQEALLSIFSSIDAPKTPSSAGRMGFLRGITNEMRQARRAQYLSLSRARLVDVAQQYFAAPVAGNTVVIGKASNVREFADRGFATKQFST